MKVRGRSILVIALLLFGGYAYYDYVQDTKKEEATTADMRLMQLEPDQVNEVEIRQGDKLISLKRSVDGWNMETPIKDAADSVAVEDLIKNAANEKIVETVKGEKIDWIALGLDKPLGSVTFKSTAGKEAVLQVADKRNFEENTYARRDNEERAILINSVWQGRVKKQPIDFRDRRVLRHSIASIDSFKLKNKNGTMEMDLRDGKWIVPGAKAIALDQSRVRETLQALIDAKGADFVEGKLPETKEVFVMDLQLAEKSWQVKVGQAKDLKLYATISEPQQQMRLEPGALDKFIALSIEDLKEGPPTKENDPKDSLKQRQAELAAQKEKK